MGERITSHRDLRVWRETYELGLKVYRESARFPAAERFGLTSQLRRSAVSVPSNIAEGYGRGSRADYVRFLKVARGSLFEQDTQLQFAVDLGYLNERRFNDLKEQLTACSKMLAGLISKLEPTNERR